MIIFISSQQPQAQSPVDERFGRAAWFMSYDSETSQWKEHRNPGGMNAGGAGIAAAQYVIDQHADIVISGAFGPNAAGALRAGNTPMKLFGSQVSTVEQAVEHYLQDKLETFE